jgi:hypothetical protein
MYSLIEGWTGMTLIIYQFDQLIEKSANKLPVSGRMSSGIGIPVSEAERM